MCMKCSGRKVSAVDSSGLGSSPGWGHYLVFLGSMTITVPLSTQVYRWVPANSMLGGITQG